MLSGRANESNMFFLVSFVKTPTTTMVVVAGPGVEPREQPRRAGESGRQDACKAATMLLQARHMGPALLDPMVAPRPLPVCLQRRFPLCRYPARTGTRTTARHLEFKATARTRAVKRRCVGCLKVEGRGAHETKARRCVVRRMGLCFTVHCS